jgi:excisionase family DNA binding protein
MPVAIGAIWCATWVLTPMSHLLTAMEFFMVQKITLSVDEMAARTGLSRTFLFGEIKDGRLASMKIGRLRLIHVDDEAAYLKAHRLAPREVVGEAQAA